MDTPESDPKVPKITVYKGREGGHYARDKHGCMRRVRVFTEDTPIVNPDGTIREIAQKGEVRLLNTRAIKEQRKLNKKARRLAFKQSNPR